MTTIAKKNKSVPAFSPRPEDTRASLCIYKNDLDPDQISELLDIVPTACQKLGGTKALIGSSDTNAKAPVGGWFLSSHNSVKNLNPEHHIQWLVDQISNRHSVIRKLQENECSIEIWVYWLASSSNASPTLSPDLMRRLGNLRIPIVFDVYF